MLPWLITMALIFALMLGGIWVDRLYRGFAARHPQLGPYRKGRCGGGCGDGCDEGACGH